MLDWNALYKSGRDFGILPEGVADLIESHTNNDTSKSLLDIGCGTGQLTRLFQARGYTCLGIDTSAEAIRIAQAHSSQISYRVFDIQNQSTEALDGPFGLITCKHVYAFVENSDSFLAQIAKLLEEKGVFVLLTPLAEDIEESKKSIAVPGPEVRKDIDRYFTVILDKPLKSGQLFILQPKGM